MRTDVPQAVKRPAFWMIPICVVGLWIKPRKYGARLATLPLHYSLVVGAACTLLAVGLALTWRYEMQPPYALYLTLSNGISLTPCEVTPPISDRLDLPLVSLVRFLHEGSFHPAGPVALIVILAVWAGVAGVIQFLLMAISATGEGLKSLIIRNMKCTAWCTTGLALFPLAVAVWPLVRATIGLSPEPDWEDLIVSEIYRFGIRLDSFDTFSVFAALVIFARTLMLSRATYAGPPNGPGWTPERPVCQKCGYVLSGLPAAGNCPECNMSNERSMKRQTRRLRFTRENAFDAAFRAAFSRRGKIDDSPHPPGWQAAKR